MALFAATLAGCIAFTESGKNYAFYLTALRAWEFVAGGAIGFFVPMASRLPPRVQSSLAAIGMAAVIGAAVKLCLMAAISASGPTAMASPASSVTSLSAPTKTPTAVP